MLCAALLASCTSQRDRLTKFPRVVLWAWQRPEDLRFIDPKIAGVAFLARTIVWQDGRMHVRPRLEALHMPPETRVMAVVRLESHGVAPDVQTVAPEITRAAAAPGISALQIDFDALSSERSWYESLLRAVRKGIRPDVPLTITALASWCEGDGWLREAAIESAVPMLFRMGPGESWHEREFRVVACRQNVGISLDEPRASLPRARRLFVFDPHSWTEPDYRAALELARRWQ